MRRGSAATISRSRGPAALTLAALGLGLAIGGLLIDVPSSVARNMRATDKARLHYISASGSVLYETGRAEGSLPGTMYVHMRVESTFSGTFKIYANGGSIIGHGSATPHGSGVYESFAGTLFVTGGTGTYRHAHGRAALYGTFDRDNYALTIKTSGTLRY
jgi:hypothetical protein